MALPPRSCSAPGARQRGLVPAGLAVLIVTCGAAIDRAAAAGDVASLAFVAVIYGALLLLLRPLRAYEHAPPEQRQHSALTKLGFAALACNSAVAVYNSWGDAASVMFVLAADAALVMLFICLRAFERGRRRNIKPVVWTLTTLLTAMFASRVAPLMLPAVAALVWAMEAATAAGGFWAFFLH
ncbi:hypothetical protein ACP70R_041864 [Stipagrostis hirtigluma subsp. patula]